GAPAPGPHGDALVALCSGEAAPSEAGGEGGEGAVQGRSAPRPARPTILIHATAEALASDDGACEISGGGIISAETARRLSCEARIQVLLEDHRGEPLFLGRSRREPSAAMVRLLKHRDRGCTFPGCG